MVHLKHFYPNIRQFSTAPYTYCCSFTLLCFNVFSMAVFRFYFDDVVLLVSFQSFQKAAATEQTINNVFFT